MRLPLCLTISLLATPVLADAPKTVTDIPAVHSLAAMVMGDLGAPSLLLDKGADPHHFQMRPSQARALANADLVIWMGPRMSPWLERSLNADEKVNIALLDLPSTQLRMFGQEHADHADHDDHDDHAHEDKHADHDDHMHEDKHADHDKHAHEEHAHDDHDKHDHEAHAHEEHAHEDKHADHKDHDDHAHEEHAAHKDHDDHAGHEDHAGHDHAHEGVDPHAWLSPANALIWIEEIEHALSDADPANAATYAANAEAAAKVVMEARDKAEALLEPGHDAPIMMFHAAYGYFAASFDLNIVDSIAEGDATKPGAGHLAELREELEHDKIVCIFPEAQHDPAYITALADGLTVKIGATLDPSGSSMEPGADLYPALLTTLATNIADCVSGAK